MLKSIVIYYPGSGGGMLSRVLSLSDKTIMGTNGENLNEHSVQVSAADKFLKFLSWGGHGELWKVNERMSRSGWKIGKNEFINYKISPLWLIERLHASEFLVYEEQRLWDPDNTFENFIFITITNDERKFIEQNQHSKYYSMNYDIELPLMTKLIKRFSNRSYLIPFESFFDQNKFMGHVQKINQWLDLELDLALALKVWRKWLDESQAVWK